MKAKYLVPLGIFLVLMVFLGKGLHLNPRDVPSPLIDKPAPDFRLPQLFDDTQSLSNRDMLGKVWLLNVYASWCESCRDEHPLLVDFAGKHLVPLIGLDYKDKPQDAKKMLGDMGNPYSISISDLDGRVGINFGVYGVPETYIIDKSGVIRLKYTGPVTQQALETQIIPKIAELSK